MKWFKHDSNAGSDAKLRKLRLKYGAQGYGIYWYCLELIARNVEKHNLTFELEHDADLIAEDFKLSGELVQEMMTYMVNLGLFENSHGVITCLKMASRTDEYTQQLMREVKKYPENIPRISLETTENIPRISLETTESVPRISEVKEEKRREEIYTPPIGSDLLKDFLKVRKAKKAGELTKTAFTAIEKEASKANLSVEQAIEICCLRGWVGFNAEWVKDIAPKKRELAL
jgi:hypothetical protein